ncbi:spore germination protein [Alkaliphilus pronyensis]|uniref:Spore germination protein n=1 Tax=Alkaliphilus pronyensis TaxID=1482732 RepID=A0A6I0FQX3_9FIRM|nr:spore germination protein [Alkaliphilus pronyensis]KAB3540959.1 spore germination protein [Alkaliphilus pronyensis]
MGLWKKLLGNKGEKKQEEGQAPHKSIEMNIKTIKEILKDCDDIVYREVEVGVENNVKAAIIYTDGMIDRNLLNNYILNNIMLTVRMTPPSPEDIKKQIASHLKDHSLAVSEMKEVETIDEGVTSILSGDTVLLIDNYDKLIIVASKGWQARGVSEPVTEIVIRGPRDGFVETFRVNTALIRRRVRDPKLKLKAQQVGVRSKTDMAIIYIEDIVNKKILKEVEERIKTIDMDAILDSGYIEQLIEDNWLSPFPQIQNTERPDVAVAALYEGRIVILVDNSPFALIAPTTLNAMLQSAEDYYERWNIATAVRLLRYLAAIISLLLPSLYVAITSFHPQMIPTKLALSIATTRQGVPFPAIVEALIMETTIELLREAGVRLPGPIGATIGIVGGLVIGQAAVEAGIVSPLMVIVVAVTAISSFAIPSYNVAIGFRLLRFGFIFAAGSFGLYGISLAKLLLLSHLCGLKSFGMPYLHPFVTFVEDIGDIKDTVIRAPMPSMNNRESIANKNERNRLDDKQEEEKYKEEEE